MKRNQLHPGQDYYYCTSTDWETGLYGYRVRVLTLQDLVQVGYGYGIRKVEPKLVTIYNGDVVEVRKVREASKHDRVDSVLCQMLTADGHPYVRQYDSEPKAPQMIRVRDLRGPWHELHTRFTAERAAREEREAKRKDELDAKEAEGRALLARARVLGVDVHNQNPRDLCKGYVDLSFEALEALIIRAEGVDL